MENRQQPHEKGLRDSLRAALIRMRHNIVQAVIGEQLSVSQPTISRAVKALILVLPGGRLVWASDPYPGSMHDVAALDSSGLLEGLDPSGWIADKGHIGRGMITPHKKPPNGELSEAAKEANKSINKIRQAVERAIAHIKAWRIHPHRLPPPPAHIRVDHHRRTLTPRLKNHP